MPLPPASPTPERSGGAASWPALPPPAHVLLWCTQNTSMERAMATFRCWFCDTAAYVRNALVWQLSFNTAEGRMLRYSQVHCAEQGQACCERLVRHTAPARQRAQRWSAGQRRLRGRPAPRGWQRPPHPAAPARAAGLPPDAAAAAPWPDQICTGARVHFKAAHMLSCVLTPSQLSNHTSQHGPPHPAVTEACSRPVTMPPVLRPGQGNSAQQRLPHQRRNTQL